MVYFTKDFLNFLSELADNNNREWFNDNKKRFKSDVEKPFVDFLAVVIDRLSAIDSRISITPKEAIFRIYRDTRFSKDKTPYKLHMSGVVAEGGRKGKKAGGIYLQASHEDFRIYSGFYMPDKNELLKVREAIAADLSGFEALITEPNFVEKFGSVQGEKNKRIPKEFAEAAEKQPLIFNKSFYVFRKFDPEILLQEDIIDICVEHFLASKALGDFFMQALED